MKKTVRSVDSIARFGGEEFIVSMPETGHNGAMILAEKLRSGTELYAFPFIEGKTVTISIGVTEFLCDDDDLNEVIRRADMALYQVKREGKNRVHLFLAEEERNLQQQSHD